LYPITSGDVDGFHVKKTDLVDDGVGVGVEVAACRVFTGSKSTRMIKI